jgi:hypothetical protein
MNLAQRSTSRLRGGLLILGLAVAALTLGPAVGASAAPSGCIAQDSGRDLGWYGDVTCSSGTGQYRSKTVCNGAGGTAYGSWVGIGSRSSAWCGWWGVSSISWQTR